MNKFGRLNVMSSTCWRSAGTPEIRAQDRVVKRRTRSRFGDQAQGGPGPAAQHCLAGEPVVAKAPTVLAPRVATAGPITGKIYMGPVDEQALAIRVEGVGVVMIVGCGHQGLANLLARSAQFFDEPLYGVIGGLHYPVPRGRWMMGGVDAQRWATYGLDKGPSAEDVQREIDLLAEKGPSWVSLSPHDSSDETIEAVRKTFGPRYHDLRVGEAQVIGGAKP